jgi:drug/metabolite transporter (DMT)-like permease
MKITNILAHLAMLAVTLIYSLNYFISKEVFIHVSALGVLGIRGIFALTFFGIMGGIIYRQAIDWKQDGWRILACAVSGIICNQLFFLSGLAKTSEINAAVLMITSPIFVFLLAYLSGTEKLTFAKIMGVLLAFTGAVLLMTSGKALSLGENTLVGDILIILNAISYSIYLILVKPLVQKYNNFALFAILFLLASMVNIPLGLPHLLQIDWTHLPINIYYGIFYIGICTTILAYSLNAWAMRTVPASYVGIYVYLQPVLAFILSLFLRSGVITWYKTAYIILVFIGVGMVMFRKKEI